VRIALVSDLHGNEIAVEAVLEQIRHLGVDGVVCLGDVATLGPRPVEVLQRLQELRCPCVLGNHDAFLGRPELIQHYTRAAPVVEAIHWCRSLLTQEQIEWLGGLPAHLELALGGATTLLGYHGSPRSSTDDLLSTTPADELGRMFGGHEAAVMAGGHTHIQMLRQHRGTLVVNPGSVGLPFREYVGGGPPEILDHAEYAVVTATAGSISVDLRRVELAVATLRASLERSDLPLASMLLQQYRA
jgi:predicted phosphodiesterase